tara:strand:+ start:498 stop:686 length:189 start_codon:yes stop_codon:yes gene_type:complete
MLDERRIDHVLGEYGAAANDRGMERDEVHERLIYATNLATLALLTEIRRLDEEVTALRGGGV